MLQVLPDHSTKSSVRDTWHLWSISTVGGGIEKLVVCGKLLGTSSSGLGLKKLVAGRKRAYTTPNNCLMIKGGHQH